MENVEHQPTHATYFEKDEVVTLSPEHREYLLKRHGTVELDPLPTASDADPYNWPAWKKVTNLLLVAFHALMSTFIAASIIPAYELIAEDLNVSLQRASYLTSLQIAIIGGGPLFWRPISTRFGRRPIFLISLIGTALFNIACARTESYGAMATCRAFAAFFICPASAIGSAVVVETFFKKERAKYMGIWTLMITLGVPLAPFIMGFVAHHIGYRWIYWILAMINGVQLLLYLFLGPETRYLRKGVAHNEPPIREEYFKFRRIDSTPFVLKEFISPLRMAKYPCVLIPALAYAMVFLFGSVLLTVEIPQLFAHKFHFNPQQLGYQFVGIIIGSLIGEQIGGYASDKWMNRGSKNDGAARPAPEYRLWLSYAGYLLTICGVIVFLVRIEQAPEGHWNVTPIVGAAIAAAGNQVVTTVLITYAVDCYHEEAASIGVFITFVRQVWGFIGPFWFPPMFEQVGVAKSAGVTSALLVAVSLIPTIFLQWKGQKIRGGGRQMVAETTAT
ncbi:MFS general substrate transporter [Delitschia confertaspora ATCC 74209]|uniref:MFS general substrate transporter n=1 Tax=Delitschia confertaspora ATCC 74209 TaxID=1513339 RepID=A0A9P4JTV6_9PLEO|nr:MFS general substrate transporter [Delitschia confertaspora ATCC 74209]